MAAGCAVLDVLRDSTALYSTLERLGARLEAGLTGAAGAAEVACTVGRVGSMVTPFLGITQAASFDQVRHADRERFGVLHAALAGRGRALAALAVRGGVPVDIAQRGRHRQGGRGVRGRPVRPLDELSGAN